MNKFFIKYVGMLSIIFLIVGISALFAELFSISTQEMLIYMLIGDYAYRIYDGILDKLDSLKL